MYISLSIHPSQICRARPEAHHATSHHARSEEGGWSCRRTQRPDLTRGRQEGGSVARRTHHMAPARGVCAMAMPSADRVVASASKRAQQRTAFSSRPQRRCFCLKQTRGKAAARVSPPTLTSAHLKTLAPTPPTSPSILNPSGSRRRGTPPRFGP